MPTSERADAWPLLEAENLSKWFPVKGLLSKKRVNAVTGASFSLMRGETLGIVGESGSGKSTLCRSVVRLIEPNEGAVRFDGVDLRALDAEQLRRARRRFQMVFQDPYASLNPRHRVGRTIGDPLLIHGLAAKRGETAERVAELLSLVGLSPDFAGRFPHEMSGGQRQRVCIARALAASPELVVFDEAVSALDVSIQAQILNLIKDLQEKLGLSYLFVSHNLGVVRHVATRVCVMYLGQIVESAPAEELFLAPRHPYTKALISAIPEVNRRVNRGRIGLSGDIPSPIDVPSGCAFRTRCPYASAACAAEKPPMKDLGLGHSYSCIL